MKKNLVAMIALMLGFLMCFASTISQAQEEVVTELEYSYGTVVSVSSNQFVVSEYDYETDGDIKVTYIMDAGVEFEGVSSLKEVTVGDIVDIEYMVKEGKNIAKTIIVEKMPQEEEYVHPEEAMPEPSPEEIEY